MVFESGKGSHLTDVDGHKYLHLCSEHNAGLFGHGHPVVNKAMRAAAKDFSARGGVNARR